MRVILHATSSGLLPNSLTKERPWGRLALWLSTAAASMSSNEWDIAGIFLATWRIKHSIMSLETKTVPQLEEIAANLREYILHNPTHSSFYKEELKDAEQWIAERQRKSSPKPADIAC